MARTQGSRADITGPLIREQALHLFARHGYAAVTMRQIAAAVGVQVGTLYTYTADKEALLVDLLQTHMEDLLAEWRDPGGDPMDRLQAFARFHIATSLDRPEAVFLSYMELRNLSPKNHALIAGLRRRYEQALEVILRDGQAEGAMRPQDARLTAMALIAMLTGVTNWYREGGRLNRAAVQAHYWELVRGAVGGRGAAPLA
ncbi:MAG: TetR/AcrR family transcriptional regulator [Paracoccus sp. (in: a-proteobacteria)]|uniref:TetR/AcrR family transcriptional regulator n=1 Tax=Paracoccus sp. TaxID=267 RepID=UPI0026E0DC46|nr:TetR/AcrR family transcriptional regulator [Paracoccus sp. (in: a-proteobacteria)]MDO5622371.1 TetR/AcrR family transcriptional regulator [Paracoccus sp. (in: a-proteobacteria)]